MSVIEMVGPLMDPLERASLQYQIVRVGFFSMHRSIGVRTVRVMSPHCGQRNRVLRARLFELESR